MSDIERSGPASLTQQLVDRFATAIDAGVLEAGERLPTTRALAEAADVNPLTAARVYRRLAELGYVTAHVGRGTFVRSRPPVPGAAGPDDEDWQLAALPARSASYAEQMLEEAFHVGEVPDLIAFSSAWPAVEGMPREALREIGHRILDERMPEALSYQDVEGLPEAREAFARLGAEHGFAQGAEEILVTSGARQGIDLVTRALVEPGDVAVVESPTFTGTLVSLQAAGARVLAMPVDDDGADIDALERVLARHEVKVVMLQPACQNPTGRTLSAERRTRLLALARERSFFVVEDAVYAALRFDGPREPALRGEAPAHVIHVESLSKTVAGGLRVGWIAARGPVLARLAQLKMNTDMQTSALPQLVAAEFLHDGYAAHVERVVPLYRERAAALSDALERHLAAVATWTQPAGGHCLWVTFDRPLDERQLYAEAIRNGVAFLPGGAVQPEPTGRTSLRLAFSLVDPERFDEGVRRLAAAARAVQRRDRVAATGPLS